jgi:hypothetical protein
MKKKTILECGNEILFFVDKNPFKWKVTFFVASRNQLSIILKLFQLN